jgi:hypothetical protein
MTTKYATDYLFENNDFFTGMMLAFNLDGNFFNYDESNDEQESDAKAIENDWRVVGQDLIMAAVSYEQK